MKVTAVLCGHMNAVENNMRELLRSNEHLSVVKDRYELEGRDERVIFVTPESCVRRLAGVQFSEFRSAGPEHGDMYWSALKWLRERVVLY